MLEMPYQESADRVTDAIQPGRIAHDLRAIKRWTKHRGMADLAAQPASDAAIVDMRHGIGSQRIAAGLDRQGRAARQADAAMIPGTGVGIDAKTLPHDALAGLDCLGNLRPDPPLLVQHAF